MQELLRESANEPMTGINGGNPNPTYGNNPDEYGEHECPFCGDTVKKLPAHLPCEGYENAE